MARVLLSGSTGMIGSELSRRLRQRGDEVIALVRRPPRSASETTLERITPQFTCDAVIHLAGEPVFGIWTAVKKQRIRDSRVLGTAKLASKLALLNTKPRSLICASAVGYYGDRGDEILTEQSPAGTGFLAETCVAWEAAASAPREAGIRVAHLRIGIVLSPRGGALKAMLLPFRLGLGARLGSGKQWMPWITLDDVVSAFLFILDDPAMEGPFNACAPNVVTNVELTRTLACALHWPAFFPVPEFALKLAPGGMAEEALLASARVLPERLTREHFRFSDPDLNAALSKLLSD